MKTEEKSVSVRILTFEFKELGISIYFHFSLRLLLPALVFTRASLRGERGDGHIAEMIFGRMTQPSETSDSGAKTRGFMAEVSGERLAQLLPTLVIWSCVSLWSLLFLWQLNNRACTIGTACRATSSET